MIKRFSVLYVGQIDLEDIGADGRDPDARRYTNEQLAQTYEHAMALAKQMVYRNGAAAHPLEAHLSDSLAMYWTSLGDGKEGVAAFREKRAPRFRGKASALPRIHPRG